MTESTEISISSPIMMLWFDFRVRTSTQHLRLPHRGHALSLLPRPDCKRGRCTGRFPLVSRPPVARKSLRPHLNQIRAWTRQGRTDAWVAHQLEVSVQQIQVFKRENGLDRRRRAREARRRALLRRRDRPAGRGRRGDRRRARGRRGAARRRGRGRGRRPRPRPPRPPRPRRPPRTTPAPRSPAAGAAGAAGADGGPGRPAARSRGPSTTARRATACGSTRPSPTTRSTPSTGPATGPVEVTIEEDQIVIRRVGEAPAEPTDEA